MHPADELRVAAGQLAEGAVVDGDTQGVAAPEEVGKQPLVLSDPSHHLRDVVAGAQPAAPIRDDAPSFGDAGLASGPAGVLGGPSAASAASASRARRS